jgi:hypothetical protein
MIQVKTYSEKGLVVKGANAEQAETIRAALGTNVVTTHNAKLGGWVFSRKREERIRELVNAMQGGRLPKDVTGTPEGNALIASLNALECTRALQAAYTGPADDLPGEWGPLAG